MTSCDVFVPAAFSARSMAMIPEKRMFRPLPGRPPHSLIDLDGICGWSGKVRELLVYNGTKDTVESYQC